jgi:hypothetical protein
MGPAGYRGCEIVTPITELDVRINTMLRALPALAVLAFAPALAAQETPEQVVQRYYETFRTGDFSGNVALMHPDALAEMKETMEGLASFPGATEEPEFAAMFGVRTVAELQALPADTLFARILRKQMQDEGMREVVQAMQVSVLGHVAEGDSLAHVVYRMRMSLGEMQVDQVQVAPLRQSNGQWRVLLTGSLAGMMNAVPRP